MILSEKLPLNATAWDTSTLFRISPTAFQSQPLSSASTPQIVITSSGLVTVVWGQINDTLFFAQSFLQTNPGPTATTSPILLSKTTL